ncbi:hypothetical protein AMATHDRAFT_5074 [Amanita thiersii Skay4041]|uniref:Uncharacterized protein n=1 Tax=Amanita thiersii Skay4041 TaxID=703135 RepID=A0A2A9NNF8_9AGAR|nr:hypothetical protein AMATHDRAFT_5074 [Amanita thiersii Skay4041]
MPDVLEDEGPSYVSSHSADVILSDIRPIRLNLEALLCINVLLDEFLYNILKNASSLSTDKLRTSLLGLLPTNLGKEALLEAEVELRAYYERMGAGAISPLDDDSKLFNLQYAFELLRLKCEAYSTLNDSDEDSAAETRLMDRMRGIGAVPFKPTRIAPAALYLTAIVEAMCEHILTNVARVAARDSSRTNATVQDLFIALCEDESIYGLFKSMKVYEQIEALANASKPRRSKSFTRSEKLSMSRTSSPFHDTTTNSSTTTTTTVAGSLRSQERSLTGQTITTPSVGSGSRSSFEKSRVMKKLINSRTSNERDRDTQSAHTHRASASQSESMKKGSLYEESERMTTEDAAALQEFDDLMRSSSTMKVSLTPDRLKTMETYKQERDQKTQQRSIPLFYRESDSSSLRSNGRKPSLRHVESIIEDEEESIPLKSPPTPPTRTRQGSLASVSNASVIASAASRSRSLSTSSSGTRGFGKKLMRNVPPPISSSTVLQTVPPLPGMQPSRDLRMTGSKAPNTFPTRVRKVQRNRESLDLDDIMNGSDDDDVVDIQPSPKHSKMPPTPSRLGMTAFSPTTRDLIDFLAEGPPEPTKLQSFDSRPEGLNRSSSTVATDIGKKNQGRLQRMISKLSLGGEKSRFGVDETIRTPSRQRSAQSLSMNPPPTVSPLANRPIPPRYPRPPSPPPSSPSVSSSEEPNTTQARAHDSQKPWEPKTPDLRSSQSPLAAHNTITPASQKRDPKEDLSNHQPRSPPTKIHEVNGSLRHKVVPETKLNDNHQQSPRHHHPSPAGDKVYPITPTSSKVSPAPTPISPSAQHVSQPSISRKPVPPLSPPTSPPTASTGPSPSTAPSSRSHLTEPDIREMHHMMSRAGNADECRLILDMFLTRAGIRVQTSKPEASSPTPQDIPASPRSPRSPASPLENTLVELFLGGSSEAGPEPSVRKLRSKRHKKDLELRPHTADGSLQSSKSSSHVSSFSKPHHTSVSVTS